MRYQEIKGDLIKLAQKGEFDVIVHGCNCFCKMQADIAPQMAKAFGCDKFRFELPRYKGDKNKLGKIDWEIVFDDNNDGLVAINAYTQYNYGRNHSDGSKAPLDYDALRKCLSMINFRFKDHHIGLPQIGCSLAGGSWSKVKKIIKEELVDCDVTVVIYKK